MKFEVFLTVLLKTIKFNTNIQFMKKMKRKKYYLQLIILAISLFTESNLLYAQQEKTLSISGVVKDAQGETLPACALYLKGNALFGTITDSDGKFSMDNIPAKSILVITYIGFAQQEIDLSRVPSADLKRMNIILQEDDQTLDEVVVTATGVEKKVSVIGAITTVNPIELKAPTRSLTTQLAGRVAGVTFTQSSGQPGKDGASFVIRGINSLTGNTEPLILIDGLKRTLDDVDPNDVESFSILKDASATAVYGLEGANGIVVIKTKSGKTQEKPSVRFSYSSSINNTTYKPKWVDAPTYARLKNEAYLVRGKKAYYTEDEITKFSDDDQNFYPNVDWYKTMVKSNNFSQKANFNISGGANVVTYYMSGGFYSEDGMFNSGNDSNANYNQFNFRSNIKADLGAKTTLGLGFDGRYNTTTEPSSQGTGAVLKIMNTLNPTLFPPAYSNGTAPEEPSGIVNPYSLLTQTGFMKAYANYMSTNINLSQKLDFITEGLYANAILSFTKNNYYTHQYIKEYQKFAPDLTYNGTGYDDDGNFHTINKTPDVDTKMRFQSNPATGERTIELQGSLNYSRSFNDKWYTSALVLYKQREYLTDVPGGSGSELLINALPARDQSIAGRATLDYLHRYFIDVNMGVSGSQMFTPDKRYSTFPSIGIGWLMSDEPFFRPINKYIDLVKMRATFGSVGSSGSASRFGYMASTGTLGGYTFGFGTAGGTGTYIPGIGETRLEQLGLTWEKNRKVNLGLELGLFNQFKLITEVYRYTNSGQLIDLNYLPATMGLPAVPKANLGKTRSQGIDFDFTYAAKFGDFSINYIKGIISYSTNKIIENGQMDPKVPYQSGLGLDWGRSLNYVALGLFKDQDDIDNSPVQTWSKVMPGDIKYKDIDGDGVITEQDRLWLGNVNPRWNYSLVIDLGWKNWVFSTRFIGKSDMYRQLGGSRIPFNPYGTETENGAIYKAAAKDHWIPQEISGNPMTENPNAKYPRLAIGAENYNNAQASTFWLREASYLRWADLELGYNWINKKKKAVKSIYMYTRCDNVTTFSKFKDWNPELTDSYAYPLKRTISIGFEIGFDL